MMIGLHHAALSTPDLERATTFYCDVLGGELVDQFAWSRGRSRTNQVLALADSAARAVFVKVGKAYLEIFEFSHPQPVTLHPNRPVCDHGLTHLCFVVEDCRAEYERLSNRGMHFHSEPMVSDDGCVYTYGRDPDGNAIEFISFNDGYSCPNNYREQVTATPA